MRAQTLACYSGKASSQLSLESLCSSGYDSAQGDSRTTTPTGLPLDDLTECLSGNFTPTHAHRHTTERPGLSLPQLYKESHKTQLEDDAMFSCTDSLSLCSASTAFSCYSCSSCGNDCTPLSSSFRTPTPSASRSQDTLTDTDIEHENSNDSVASQVIHKLKRRSDGWTGPLVKPTDPILSRLKRGRAEAIRRQEVIEVP